MTEFIFIFVIFKLYSSYLEIDFDDQNNRKLLYFSTTYARYLAFGVVKTMSLQPTDPKTVEELLAQIRGEDMEEFRRNAVLRKQLNIEAERYYDVPANLWPTLQFNWDTTLACQRFALDGVKQNEFKTLIRKHHFHIFV